MKLKLTLEKHNITHTSKYKRSYQVLAQKNSICDIKYKAIDSLHRKIQYSVGGDAICLLQWQKEFHTKIGLANRNPSITVFHMRCKQKRHA